MRRRTSSRRPTAPRRKLLWARENFTATNSAPPLVASGFTPLGNLETALGADLVGATIVRILGSFTLKSYQTAATSWTQVAYGWMVVPLIAGDIVANQPGPWSDRFSSWMGWDSINIPHSLAAAVGDSSSDNIQTKQFDIKGKRVLRQVNDSLIFCVENRAGGANIDWSCTMSIALLLP